MRTPLRRRKPKRILTKEQVRLIAIVICRNEKPLKQVAFDFGISYGQVYRILREEIVVKKVLSLKFL